MDFSVGREVVVLGDFNLPSLKWLDGGDGGAMSCTDRLFLDCFTVCGFQQWVHEPTFVSSEVYWIYFLPVSQTGSEMFQSWLLFHDACIPQSSVITCLTVMGIRMMRVFHHCGTVGTEATMVLFWRDCLWLIGPWSLLICLLMRRIVFSLTY